jgi:hypothetical protein
MPHLRFGLMQKKRMYRLAEDIRASLHDALDYAAGRHTKAVVHQVTLRPLLRARARSSFC